MKRALTIAAGLLVTISLFLLPVVGNAGFPAPPLPPPPPLLLPPPPGVVVIEGEQHRDSREHRREKKHKKYKKHKDDRHDEGRHEGHHDRDR
jgi:hypothetical protein